MAKTTKTQAYNLVGSDGGVVVVAEMPWLPDGEPKIVMWKGRAFLLAVEAANPDRPHVYREEPVYRAR